MPRLAFLLGAGASVDSGLMTYRGIGGLYNNSSQGQQEPEDVLTTENFNANPAAVWSFLKPLYEGYGKASQGSKFPGATYQEITKLVTVYPDSFVLTQNVDGFVRDLGCPYIELHGNMHTAQCPRCREIAHVTDGLSLIPTCSQCHLIMKPNIVLFGDDLHHQDILMMNKLMKTRPTHFIIIGTGLHFPYLRKLVDKAKQYGAQIIHINPDPKYKHHLKSREIWFHENSLDGLRRLEKELED